MVLEGEIRDSSSGETYTKGNYISLEKGSSHYPYSEKGCILLVFSKGNIERYENWNILPRTYKSFKFYITKNL